MNITVRSQVGSPVRTSPAVSFRVVLPTTSTATPVMTLSLNVSAFYIGGSNNPARVQGGTIVPVHVARSGVRPNQYRISATSDFRDANWRQIGTSIQFAVPPSPLGTRRFYFQQRYVSGSTVVASNVVSDDVEVCPPFNAAIIAPQVVGQMIGTHSRLLCPTGQIMTGVRIRQDKWIEAIGPICAGVNRPMAGNLQGGGELASHTCPAGQVPLVVSGETRRRFGDTTDGFRMNGKVVCLTNVFGGNTFNPLDANPAPGSTHVVDAVCPAPTEYIVPPSAPIGIDVYVNQNIFGQVGLTGIGVICARPI